MDTLFQLEDSDRPHVISSLFHSLGFSYISLWLHVSPQNYLQCKFGHYQEQQPSSSYGSLARQLFDEYHMQSILFLNDNTNLVPGVAFKRRNPCIVLRELDLQHYASSDIQRQFYLEARIKTAVFMGCRSGEIELGFSNVPQNLELELKKLFPEEFHSMDHLSLPHIPSSLQDPQQQSRPSSSSSRSLDSPEYPSFLFNLASMRDAPLIINQSNTTSICTSPIHPQPNPFTHQPFLTPQSVDAAITNALLASLTAPSSMSSLPTRFGFDPSKRRGEFSSAFRSCRSSRIRHGFRALSTGFRRHNMMKKVFSYYRGLNIRRLQQHHASQELGAGGLSRPTSTQLHHVMSERKRREKINESFQALRALLPPGTKKDKATVLRTTKEYMRMLKDQISELSRSNQILESQLSFLGAKVDKYDPDTISSARSSTSNIERFHVQLTPVMESSSTEERRMDLRVSVGGNGRSMIDLVTRLLEFLKGVQEVRLASMEAQTVVSSHEEQQAQQQQNSINRVTLRLTIEGYEWDQSAFLEAVKRVVADLAH